MGKYGLTEEARSLLVHMSTISVESTFCKDQLPPDYSSNGLRQLSLNGYIKKMDQLRYCITKSGRSYLSLLHSLSQ